MIEKTDSYHHGNLREALLDAAEQQLVNEGINKLSLRGTAKLAGVSHNAPYRHFRDKSALLRGVAQRGFEALGRAMLDAAAGTGSVEQRLIEAGVTYVRLALAHPDRTRLMFGGNLEGTDGDRAFIDSANSAFRGLMGLIESGVKQGVFFGEPEELAITAWSAVHGFSLLVLSQSLHQDSEDSNPITLARQMATRVVRGLMSPVSNHKGDGTESIQNSEPKQ